MPIYFNISGLKTVVCQLLLQNWFIQLYKESAKVAEYRAVLVILTCEYRNNNSCDLSIWETKYVIQTP